MHVAVGALATYQSSRRSPLSGQAKPTTIGRSAAPHPERPRKKKWGQAWRRPLPGGDKRRSDRAAGRASFSARAASLYKGAVGRYSLRRRLTKTVHR